MPIINMVYKKKKGWKPGANTIAYYPLETDAKDYSGNGYNGTWGGTADYVTLASGKNVANFQYSSAGQNYIGTSLTTSPSTVSFWIYFDNLATNPSGVTGQDWRCPIGQYDSNWSGWNISYSCANGTLYGGSGTYQGGLAAQQWLHICITNGKVYMNGTELFSCGTLSSAGNALKIGTNNVNTDWISHKRALWGKMSEVIIENKARTAEQVAGYYNQTKSQYGIS